MWFVPAPGCGSSTYLFVINQSAGTTGLWGVLLGFSRSVHSRTNISPFRCTRCFGFHQALASGASGTYN